MATFWNKETKRAKGLAPGVRAVLRELGDTANADGTSWAKQETIAAELGVSERTVRRHLKTLEAMGWIERTRRHRKDGSRTSDFVQLRTLEDAIAWALENTPLASLGGGDDPDPGTAQPAPAIPTPANVSTRQRVNRPAHPSPRPASPRPAYPGRDVAAQIGSPPVDEIHRDLMIRLQVEGLETPAEWPAGSEPPGDRRKASGS